MHIYTILVPHPFLNLWISSLLLWYVITLFIRLPYVLNPRCIFFVGQFNYLSTWYVCWNTVFSIFLRISKDLLILVKSGFFKKFKVENLFRSLRILWGSSNMVALPPLNPDLAYSFITPVFYHAIIPLPTHVSGIWGISAPHLYYFHLRFLGVLTRHIKIATNSITWMFRNQSMPLSFIESSTLSAVDWHWCWCCIFHPPLQSYSQHPLHQCSDSALGQKSWSFHPFWQNLQPLQSSFSSSSETSKIIFFP